LPAGRAFLYSFCKKTPTTALFSFLKQSFTKSKLLDFKNFESLACLPEGRYLALSYQKLKNL